MSDTTAANDRRREQGDSSRKLILGVASKLIAEKGFDATSLSMIAKESGLPSSSIYWHFGSKEGVLAAVMQHCANYFFEFSDKAPWFEGEPAERLEQAFVYVSRSLIEEPIHRQFLIIQLRLRLNRPHRRYDADTLSTADAVRARGIEFMGRWITTSYAEHGREVSEKLGAQFSEFGVMLVDGAFLSLLEPAGEVSTERVEQVLGMAGKALSSAVENELARVAKANG